MGRPRLLLNFRIVSDSKYSDSDDKPGSFAYDGKTSRIVFKGGGLDGVMPAGVHTIYHEPKGQLTVSFRNREGTDILFL